jgi:hypothetical protein
MGGATFGASLGVQATVMGTTSAYTGTLKRVMRGEQLTLGTLMADAVPGAAPALARIAAPVARHLASKLLGTYASLARAATNNANAAEVVLGKYNQGGVSYVAVATERRATFFQIDDWDKVVESVGGEKYVWNINKEFLKQQEAAGKAFLLSHDPSQATGFFKREVEQLADMGYRFVQEGELWRGVK